MRRSAWSKLALVLLGAACMFFKSVPGIAQSVPDLAPVLHPGDVVRIHVWRQSDFSGEFEVTGEGTIAHPLLQQIQVAQRDVSAVEEDLRKFLRRFVTNPSFIIEGLFSVPIGGEVRQPDVYRLRPETSVARAVALAGGATNQGNLERVTLRREGENYRIDLTDPSARLRELQVRSGDEIVVERRRDIFRRYIAPSASIVGALTILLRVII